jgi:hypothetical protein
LSATVNVTVRETALKIRAGYDIAFESIQDVPMVLMLTVHPSRQADILTDHAIHVSPKVLAKDYMDVCGNVCTRLVAPAGLIEIRNEFLVEDCSPSAPVRPIEGLPEGRISCSS